MSCNTCHQHICVCNNTPQRLNSSEILYVGGNLTCGDDLVVKNNESISTALSKLVTYLCSKSRMIGNGIIGNTTIYQGGDHVTTAITNIIEYINTSSSTGSIISVSYLDLMNLINNSALEKGQIYLLNDFQTIYDQPDYSDKTTPKSSIITITASVEPIIFTAISVNTISSHAYSVLHPTDILHYTPVYTLPINTATPTKGKIYYREDEWFNKCNYDFRTVLFKRYGTAKNYWDIGNTPTNYLTFQDSASSNDFTGKDFNDSPLDFDLPNIVCFGEAQNNVFGSIQGVTFINQSIGNIVTSKFWYSEFDSDFTDNKFDIIFINTVTGYCTKNIINNFSRNIITNVCTENKVINISNNTVQTIMYNSGHDYSNNTVLSLQGNNFYRLHGCTLSGNVINNDFKGEVDNITGIDMKGNTGFNFTNNTLPSILQVNDFKTNISGIDFSSATHVANEYNCEIIENANLDIVLRYVDEYNAIVTTTLTE